MCQEHIKQDMARDGRLREVREVELCSRSRNNRPCERLKSYNYDAYPPTPPMSSHSGHTSDSDRSSRRRSGVYLGDHKVLDIQRKRSSRHERHGSSDRLSFEDHSPISSSPLSRSPASPRRSNPTSPIVEFHDTRPSPFHPAPKFEIEIELPDKSHHYHATHRKTSSSKAGSSSHDDSSMTRRTRRSSVHFAPEVNVYEQQRKIDRANNDIAHRAPVPSVPKGYRRGSVSLEPIVSATERLRIEAEKRQRKAEKEREKEQREQNQRLKNRQNRTYYT